MIKAHSKVTTTEHRLQAPESRFALHCPVSSLSSMRAAIDNGADGVILDFGKPFFPRNHCKGEEQFDALACSVRYAMNQQVETVLAIKALPPEASWSLSRAAIDTAVELGMDAVAMSTPALMLYAAARHPSLKRHYTVPVSATSAEAISFLCKQIEIHRLVLPRMTSLRQIKRIATHTGVEVELAGFGPLCNIVDNFSPASTTSKNNAMRLRSELEATFLDFDTMNASGGSCALDEEASNDHYYLDLGNMSASALRLLPQLPDSGVRALQIDLNVRSPLKLAQVTRVWREAIDQYLEHRDDYAVQTSWVERLNQLAPALRACHGIRASAPAT